MAQNSGVAVTKSYSQKSHCDPPLTWGNRGRPFRRRHLPPPPAAKCKATPGGVQSRSGPHPRHVAAGLAERFLRHGGLALRRSQVEHQNCETPRRHWLPGAREKGTTVCKGPAATAASASSWPSSLTSGPSGYSSFSPCFAENTCVEETPFAAPQHDVPEFHLQRDPAGAQVGEQAVDVVQIAPEKRAGRGNRVGVALRQCGGRNSEYTAANIKTELLATWQGTRYYAPVPVGVHAKIQRPSSCLRLLTCL